ncbi:MAG: DUF1775 domain-containing protein [Actinomycetota bacterium]|nr:DUF1775 domain-containing protein [Actinomycetota bacterium]
MQSRLYKNALRSILASSIVAATAIGAANSASAHMGLDLRGAAQTAGKSAVIFFRPGHGCDGDATNSITVTIPTGVTGVKAQQKAGWTTSATADTVSWTTGVLPDEQFDDFGLRLTWPKLPAGVASQTFYFKTVQTCDAEIRVSRSGEEATITGALPGYEGESVDLFSGAVPLTKHAIVVGPEGKFTLKTTSIKVPEGTEVVAKLNGKRVGNSTAGAEAWIDLPIAGSSAALASPAPSVTVVA